MNPSDAVTRCRRDRGVPVGAEHVGAEVADQVGLAGGRHEVEHPQAQAERRPRPGEHRGPQVVAAQRPLGGGPGCSTRHWPSIRRWVCSVVPVSKRCSRCLPRATTSRVRDPARSTSGTEGQRSSARSTTASRRAASSRSAVRCTVSPSGTAGHLRIRSPRGVRWKPASSRAATTGWPEPSTWPPSAFSTVIRPRLPRRTASARARGRGPQQIGVIGIGEQRLAAALDVEHSSPSTSTTTAPALRPGWWRRRLSAGVCRSRRGVAARCRRPRDRRRGRATAAPRRTGWPGRWRRARRRSARPARGRRPRRRPPGPLRSRSTAPVVPNWEAPRPSTK